MTDIKQAIEDLVREHRIDTQRLTEGQFVEAIRQAVTAGDFLKYVMVVPDERQAVVYLPYADKARLARRVDELETALKELCELKRMKVTEGCAPEYLARRGPSWKAAMACFPEYADPEEGRHGDDS